MFAYCCNNPTNYTDATGELSVSAVKCIISVVTSVACDIVGHASLGEIVVNATIAATSAVFKPLGTFITVVTAVKTAVVVTQTTGDLGFGLFMGGMVIGTSMCTGENLGKLPGVENFDDAAELFLDATVGFAANLICSKGTYDYTDGYVSRDLVSKDRKSTWINRTIHSNRNYNIHTVALY